MTSELGKGYTQSRLRYFRRFYDVFSKCPTLSDKLSYSHYCELIWFNDYTKINYYIKISVEQNISVRQLRQKIKDKEYERLPVETKDKIITNDNLEIKDLIPNPIIINNKNNQEIITEKVLRQLILEDIESFMKELGSGFSFIGSEYKIKLGDRYNYIDLLLYNIKYKCYVVIELKVTELSSSHTGQIQNYMNYIDKNIKGIEDNKTVGIIICRKNNQYVIEYCSDSRIISREYELV